MKVGPPFVFGVPPSTVQSTLMTAGSMTFTFSMVGLLAAPAGGSTESHGCWPARQMSMAIFSRDTELYEVFGLSPNKLFIIEFELGRHVRPPVQAKNPCIPVPGVWL